MKYLLEILDNEGNITTSTEYSSLKAILEHYPSLSYHQLKSIYAYHSGHKKKFLHPVTRELVKVFRITQIPFNPFANPKILL